MESSVGFWYELKAQARGEMTPKREAAIEELAMMRDLRRFGVALHGGTIRTRPGRKFVGETHDRPVRGFRARIEATGGLFDVKPSLGGAAIGGLAFGPTGAAVGALMGKRPVTLVLLPPEGKEERYPVDAAHSGDARTLIERIKGASRV